MNITDVRIRKVDKDGKMKAVASITIDDCFVVHDLKVIAGPDKLFVAMPSRRTKDGEFKDIAHPIKSEIREEIGKLVLEAYQKVLAEKEEKSKGSALAEPFS